jgi:hypothetical protein
MYELVCDSCSAEYEITYVEGIINRNDPMYCPFCRSDVDLTDVIEEECDRRDVIYTEIDFEDDQ